MTHAKLSASGSSRWLNCPGSIKAEESYKNTTNSAAAEGTLAHELAEKCLITGSNAEDYLGDSGVSQEMVDNIQGYVDYVESFDCDDRYIEQRVDFSDVVPNGYGTADAIIVKGDLIRVIDLKYGQGVTVDAHENMQGFLYCVGAVQEFGFLADFNTFIVDIYQPRKGNFQTWEFDREYLDEKTKWIAKQAKLALTDDAPRIPSNKACQWCKAKADCPALFKHTQETMMIEFEELDADVPLPIKDTLTASQVSSVVKNKPLIESWLKAVSEKAKDSLLSGQHIEGLKIVEGRGRTNWKDENVIIDKLKAMGIDPFEQKLLSPNKIKQAIKKDFKQLQDQLVKSSGAPTLVSSCDKRPSLDFSDDFSDINC